MSTGRYVVEGGGQHWVVTDLAQPGDAVSVHRTREEAETERDRLDARHARPAPARPQSAQGVLFKPKGGRP